MTGRGAVWRDVLARSWRVDRRNTLIVLLLITGQVVAFALTGLALRAVVLGAIGNVRWELIGGSAVAAAGLGLAWVGQYVIVMLRGDLADQVGYLQIDPLVQQVTAELDGLEHLERPDFLRRLSLLAGKGQVLADAAFGLLLVGALAGQIAVILAVLAFVSPVFLIMGLCVIPGAFLGRAGIGRIRRASLAAAESGRLERQLHDITTQASAGKEIRVTGAAGALIGLTEREWDRATAIAARGRMASARLTALGSLIFFAGYAGALAYAVLLVHDGQRSVADLVLVVTLAGQLRAGFNQAVWQIGQLQAGLALAEPYLWLLDYAARHRPTGAQPPPSRLREGITLRGVTFAYPGSDQPVLGPLDVRLPAGAMVALVGEYGAGKTTLVKLLCKFYPPDTGTIEVDGVALDKMDTAAWRAATTAAFQDFGRYQATLRHSVGIGDLPARNDDGRVTEALHQAQAGSMLAGLPAGIGTQLGDLFEGGVQLSEGQWQKVALARACMRRQPLLVVLDEPTASLDPPSEHAIFSRHARLAAELGASHGTITVVVSHRFSTVRMADLILVLRDGRVAEQGSHGELMAAGGTYAELYGMQQAAYQRSGE